MVFDDFKVTVREGKTLIHIPDHLVLKQGRKLLITLLQDGVIDRKGLLGRQIDKVAKRVLDTTR